MNACVSVGVDLQQASAVEAQVNRSADVREVRCCPGNVDDESAVSSGGGSGAVASVQSSDNACDVPVSILPLNA